MERMRTIAALALAAAFIVSVLAVAPGRAQPPNGSAGSFRLDPVDLDSDGHYDRLVATFLFNVTIAGNFQFVARLGTSLSGPWLVTNNTDANLTVGSHLLAASLAGPRIYESRVNGPYGFELDGYPVDEYGATSPPVMIQTAVTPAWNATDFDAPWATILPSGITASGLDTNGNGLFDYLVIHVPIQVNASGPVLVFGYLVIGSAYVRASLQEPAPLRPGPTTWDLRIPGPAIRAQSPAAPPTWAATLSLVLGFLQETERVTYTVTGFSVSQFDGGSAYFRGPVTSETPDPDGDGVPDYATVHLPVHVNASGDFLALAAISGPLSGGQTGTFAAYRLATLPAGNVTVDFDYSGAILSQVGPGTGFRVQYIFERLPAYYPDYPDVFGGITTLADLSTSGFVRPAPAVLSFQDPTACILHSCNLYAFDPSQKFFTYGGTSVTLYNGTFTVYATIDNTTLIQSVTMAGNEALGGTFVRRPNLAIKLDARVLTWNETDVSGTADMGYQSPLYRLAGDAYGNFDGTADASELRLLGEVGAYGLLGDQLLVTVDNRTLPQETPRVVGVDGAGSTSSTASVVAHFAFVHRSAYPPMAGLRHTLVLDGPYSGGGPYGAAQIEEQVHLMDGATGNLTAVTFLPDPGSAGGGFTYAANATISQLGSNAWDLQVGGRPSGGFYYYTGLRVIVEAYGPVSNPVVTAIIMGVLIGGPLLALLALFVVFRRRRKATGPPKLET